MKKSILISLLFLLMLGFGMAVSPTQMANAAGAWYVYPGDLIQEAIDTAIDDGGGTIHVAAGEYTENIVISGAGEISLTIMGNGSENTILRQEFSPSVTVTISAAFPVTVEHMSIINTEGRALEIDGSSPTIRNCYLEGQSFEKGYWHGWSTAVFSHGSSEKHIYPEIINCTLKGAGRSGGGMTNLISSPTVEGCVFLPVVDPTTGYNVQNANRGGGMYNENSSPIVKNCEFYTWAIRGGGIYNFESSTIVEGCYFNTGAFYLGWDAPGKPYTIGTGGGILNSGGSPIVKNCEFVGGGFVWNAGEYGGGIYNDGSSPIVTDCRFLGTNAQIKGGGMYNSNSSPEVTNCLFRNNMAQYGGGIYSGSNPDYEGPPPKVRKSSFIGCVAMNEKPEGGGGPQGGNGGGMYSINCSPEVINCTFVFNFADEMPNPDSYEPGNGGGMYNLNASPVVTNCTFRWNYALLGGGMFNVDDEFSLCLPVVTNSILWENFNLLSQEGCGDELICVFTCDDQIYGGTPTVTYSNVQLGGYTLDGNIDADPDFLISEFPSGNPDDLLFAHQLQSGSPCINSGNNDAVPEWLTTDLEGDPRISNGTVDMGADEYVPDADGDGIYDIKESAIGALSALLSTGDNKTDKRIEKAIENIEKSLAQDFWEDDTHLTKKGKKVFDNEKKAVKHLQKLIKDKKVPDYVKYVCKEVIDELLTADKLLSETALNDAKEYEGTGKKVDKEIEKSEKELEKATKELEKGKPDKAIDHYKKAWAHAQKAMKKVPEPDEDPE